MTRGRRFRLERVELPANLFILEAEILRLLDLDPGDPVDDGRVLQGLARVAVAFHRLTDSPCETITSRIQSRSRWSASASCAVTAASSPS